MLHLHCPMAFSHERSEQSKVRDVKVRMPDPPAQMNYFSAVGERTSDKTGDREQGPYPSVAYTLGQDGRVDPWASPEAPSAPTRIITDMSVRPSINGSRGTYIPGEPFSNETYREVAVGLLDHDPEDVPASEEDEF